MKVRLADAALRALDGIWLHLAIEASEAVATRTINAIEGACRRLESFPLSGAPHEEIGLGGRSVRHGSYLAYHVVMQDHVLVTRVIHTAQDIGAVEGLGPGA